MHFNTVSAISEVSINSFQLECGNNIIRQDKNVKISLCLYLIARYEIIIGDNSKLAYGRTILITADPNGLYNILLGLLSCNKLLVIIGYNAWIRIDVTILQKVINDYVVLSDGFFEIKEFSSEVLIVRVQAMVNNACMILAVFMCFHLYKK